MSPIATRAPCAISALAVARPIPLAPPVIATIFPASDRGALAIEVLLLTFPMRWLVPDCTRRSLPLIDWLASQAVDAVRVARRLCWPPRMEHFRFDGQRLAYTVYGD